MIECDYNKAHCLLKGNTYDIIKELVVIMIAMMDDSEFGNDPVSMLHEIVDYAAKKHHEINLFKDE